MLGLKCGVVGLYDHEKEWEENAVKTINRLKTVFGDAAADIQHVGSTAVSAIKAKPIIDIAVAANSFDEVNKLISELEKAGFIHRPQNDEKGEIYFTCGNNDENIITHHIHVVQTGSKEWENYIIFRDYLNENSTAAREYEALKIHLMAEYNDDRPAYTNGKAEYIQKLLRKAKGYFSLGKIVTVTVDRPIGSVHPEHSDIIYPVNYGFIKGIAAADGEEQDAYILGINEPVINYEGVVTAVIHREDDTEDKWVVVPDGVKYDQAEIMEAVYFQEKYFKTAIDNIYQKSAGMIIFRKNQDSIEYLLLFQNRSRTWSFPKGHIEAFENEMQTAMREVGEETKLSFELIPDFREEISYRIGVKYYKTVILFLAEIKGKIEIKADEIAYFRWVGKKEACKLLVHEKYHAILNKAEMRLMRYS